MGFLASLEDFSAKNIEALLEAREKGIPVVGIYCTYGPVEPILAAGAIPVGVCGTSQDPIPAAERHLPRNLCPLIKSSYGFAITDTCPFFHISCLILGETTCDGKKKMFELMATFKDVYVLQLPQMPSRETSLELYYQEIVKFKEYLENRLGVKITPDKLKQAISLVNRYHRALKELYDLNKNRPPLLKGTELVKIGDGLGHYVKWKERVGLLEALVEEVRDLAHQGYRAHSSSSPRILLTGTPVGSGCTKVVELVEECGGAVVAMENCSGYKTVGLFIEEEDERDPLWLLAEKYIIRIPCSVMSPNRGRLELLAEMVKEFQVEGVIDLTWQACHTYNIEAFLVEQLVKDRLGLPYLHLETDYSPMDRENLRVRIEAFLEMVRARQALV